MVVLVLLFLLSLGAAIAVGDRLAEDVAECVVVVGLVWTGIVVLPMYALGLLGVLTRTTVTLATLTATVAAVALVCRPLNRASAERFVARAEELIRLPARAVVVSARTNVLLAGTLIVAYVYYAWLVVDALYSPYNVDWDVLWYHEPLIGTLIQNRGFAVEAVPIVHQNWNGYPRLGETVMAWFALWGGRQVVDCANFVFVPLFVAATYGFIRRFVRDRAVAIAFGVALFMMPGTVRLMRSAMVDVPALALMLAAYLFVTHPKLTRARAGLFVLAAMLAAGTKLNALPTIAWACVVFPARLFFQRKELGVKWAYGVVGAGVLAIGGMLSVTYLRNWIHFKNPIWPIGLDNDLLGVHFRGSMGINTVALEAKAHYKPPSLVAKMLFARPYSENSSFHSWHVDDYGFGVGTCILPLAFASAVIAFGVALFLLIKERGQAPSSRAKLARNAALVGSFLVLGYWTTHATYIPRLLLAPIAAGLVTICWLFSGPRAVRALPALAFFMQASSLLMAWWADDSRRWVKTPAEMLALLRTPAGVREVSARFKAPVDDAAGLAREREIGPGDIVGYDESFKLPGSAWNNAFSNQVRWLDDRADPLGQGERMGAKWIIVEGSASLLGSQLAKAADRWQVVGRIASGTAYRRRE